MMTKHKRPFDIGALSLEDEIANIIGTEPMKRWDDPLPPIEYVPQKHREEPAVHQDDLDQLTVEAIQNGHELAAAALDMLCKEINERVKQIEGIKAQAAEQMAMCRELAEQYRDAGKLMSAKIEMTQSDLAETRRAIDNMRKKIIGN